MPQGTFTDKQRPPTTRKILRALGKTAPLWSELTKSVREGFLVEEELKFYGKNFGWALRFRHRGKALVSLYPCEGRFKAQVVLNESAVRRALKRPLGARIHRQIRSAYPYPDGRWLFLDVATEADVLRIEQLVALKVNRVEKTS